MSTGPATPSATRGALTRSVTQEEPALYVAHVVAAEPARRDSFVA